MRLFLLILIPYLFTTLIALYGEKSSKLRTALVMASSLITFGFVLSLIAEVSAGIPFPREPLTLINRQPFIIQFQADSIALYMGLLVSSLWILTNIYSFGYMEHEHSHTRYFASLTFCLGSTMGIIFSHNLVTLFVFYELLTIGVYPLVIHEETEKAYRGGMVYGSYLLTGGALLLLGMTMVYSMTGGNLTFTPGGILKLTEETRPYLYILFVIMCCSFGVKSAMIPFQNWLPIAMVAPTPISAVLHAVAVVNMGLFGMIRMIYNVYGIELFQTLGLNTVIAVMASITILLGAFVALRQKEIKAMLAYSTINQLSYVLLGIVSFKYISVFGGLLHIVYHSFMKITLFYCAGAIITQSGNKYISGMKGLAKKMPITMFAFTIAAIGVIGLPPICGWVSKWYMVQGYMQLNHPFFAAVFIISGIIEVGYFLPPIALAYFAKEDDPDSPDNAVPLVLNSHASHNNEHNDAQHGHNHSNTNTAHSDTHDSHSAGHDDHHGADHHNNHSSTTEDSHGHEAANHHPVRQFTGKLWEEAPLTMLIPIVIVCTLSVIYGIWAFIPHQFAKPALIDLVGGMVNLSSLK